MLVRGGLHKNQCHYRQRILQGSLPCGVEGQIVQGQAGDGDEEGHPNAYSHDDIWLGRHTWSVHTPLRSFSNRIEGC